MAPRERLDSVGFSALYFALVQNYNLVFDELGNLVHPEASKGFVLNLFAPSAKYSFNNVNTDQPSSLIVSGWSLQLVFITQYINDIYIILSTV